MLARRRRPRRPGRHRRLVARPVASSARSSCSRPSTSRRGSSQVAGLGQGGPGRARAGRARSAPTSPTAWRSSSASSCCASRWTPSARSWATTATSEDLPTATASQAAPSSTACPTTSVTPIEREIDQLERTARRHTEHGWIRTWLDTVARAAVGRAHRRPARPGDARAVLDADHTGLDEVKDRIVEFLAVRKLRAERGHRRRRRPAGRKPGAILALVGPPGVGKTSLGESIARALGRKFVRVALGGVRDEAEIRGHRRTYVGAQPGRIVRALTEAGTMNPVFLLDEVDKVGSDWRGDPSVGAARGARPGPEPHVPRPLPRGRPRPVRRAVHRHGQRARHHPRPAAGPHGDRPASTATPTTRRSPSPATTCWPASSTRNGLRDRRGRRHRRRPATHRRRLHPGGRRAEPRARSSARCCARSATRVAGGEPTARSRSTPTTSSDLARPPAVPRRGRGRPRRRSPAWPPAWPSPAPAATCCSSRPPLDGRRARACTSPASSATS